jgi:hypothetical protein
MRPNSALVVLCTTRFSDHRGLAQLTGASPRPPRSRGLGALKQCRMEIEGHSSTAGKLEAFSWDEDHALRLIGLGTFLGCFHVLTPDHLSALSALGVNGSWRSFSLGVRWSFGHSIGLLIVMAVFLYFKGDLDFRIFAKYCDGMVGLFMIVIGSYGIVGSLKTYYYKQNKRVDEKNQDDLEIGHMHENRNSSKEADNSWISQASGAVNRAVGAAQHGSGSSHLTTNSANSASAVTKETSLLTGHEIPFLDIDDPFTQRLVSIAMGLLHGVAGPGGILGVLPAIEMRHWQSSTLYLGSFIIASTFSMGAFAAM